MSAALARLRAAADRLDAAALAAAAALAIAFWLPRLPASLGAISPRRAGFAPLSALVALQAPGTRAAAMAAAYAFMALAALVLALRAREHWRRFAPGLAALGWGERAARAVCLAAGVFLLARAARFGLTASLDLLQNAFYPPESLSVLEPVWTLLAFAWFGVAFVRAAAALLEWTLSSGPLAAELARDWIGWAAALLAPGLALFLWGWAAFDAGKPSLAAAAGLPPPAAGARRLAILTEQDGRPAQQPYTLDLGRPGDTDYDAARLDAAERFLARGRSVYARAALRFLYAGRAFESDPEGLRRALALGLSAGDPLARALLLSHLGCASGSARAHELLDALSDETRWRVGPAAAARLSAAYARQGDAAASRRWRALAQGPAEAPAPGLLEETAAQAPQGAIAGALTGVPGARVGLYCRPEEFSPYALSPGQLVAAAVPDDRGRFRFADLPFGAYFLAVSQDLPARPKAPLSVLGHKGDLVLTRRRPAAAVTLRAR